MVFGFCRTSVLIPSEDGILIIAALMQRFSTLVFSCSNPIPEIKEQVQRDFQISSFKGVSAGSSQLPLGSFSRMSVVLPREMSNPPMDRVLQRKHNINTVRIILSRPLGIDLEFSGWSDDGHANLLSLENRTEIHRRKIMKSSTRDEAEGKLHQVKGKIKEIAGKISMNPDLEAEGQDESLSGKAQEKIGQIEKVMGK